MVLITIIVFFSILLQLTAAIMALRLIAVTGKRIAWLAISIAITLMALRRVDSFIMLLEGIVVTPSLILFEVIGLVTSVLMLAGIFMIRPLFLSITRSEEEARNSNTRLNALSQEQEQLIGDLQDALENIRTLKGMLPICASCKKIRDDKGYWNQLESYIRDHTDVEFSHGICPECARTLYPEYYQTPPEGS
jgi:hypothetical protein